MDDKLLTVEKKLKRYENLGYEVPKMNLIKNEEQIQGIKESAKINIALLDYIGEFVKVGVTTEYLDTLIYEETIVHGAIPAPLNYEGFPKSCCISINDEVCHGIPNDQRILQDGDILNIDVSTNYNGYFSDSSRMFCVGNITRDKKQLMDIAKECMEVGIEQIKPWTPLGNVGAAVYTHAVKNGYSVVREVGGHGVGLAFHEEPWVSFVAKKDTGMMMVPGMMFTVEPMINIGSPSVFIDEENGWTIYTVDHSLSAQWEKTILVTEDGYEVIAY